MVTNLKDRTIFTVSKRLSVEKKIGFSEEGAVEYSNLVRQLEKEMLPLEVKGKYLRVKFPDYSIPLSALKVFYEVQLLGYIPIIENAELNNDFRKNPQKLYEFVTKGALVQIDEASILGENGKKIRKFIIKLCRHHLVHIVSPKATIFAKEYILTENSQVYLGKKVSTDYVDYLKSNVKHVREGNHFHSKKPVKFRKNQ